jgi:hypothetical protein
MSASTTEISENHPIEGMDVILYRDNSIDSFAGAWVHWGATRRNDQIYWACPLLVSETDISKIVELSRGKHVLVIGCYFDGQQLAKIDEESESLVIIDHQQTTLDVIEKYFKRHGISDRSCVDVSCSTCVLGNSFLSFSLTRFSRFR